jgi:2-polyprenyl-6-hydroxyphenyl methylase/3-demethylubiquinone-9 3-methyltransferase
MTTHAREIAEGKRFEFGKNWTSFLAAVTDDHVREAERSLAEMLGVDSLEGKRFLDAGSGSGLLSLAARRLGATVYSFDYDPASAACTAELRRRYSPDDRGWTVGEGSVLDAAYMASLGRFDVVCSWGVLHHTGNMWKALGLIAGNVAPGGWLYIAIYNDQGWLSRYWTAVKKLYCSGTAGRLAVSAAIMPYFALRALVASLVRHRDPVTYFREYRRRRGMSAYHDWVDWLGGYPFEVAAPEAIFRFYRDLGFELRNLETTNRQGCNQFVFERRPGPR